MWIAATPDFPKRFEKWLGRNSRLEFGQTPAAVLYLLLTQPADWVHRRVESLTLLDDTTLRRRVSVDLTVPAQLDVVAIADTTVPYVPVTLLKKEALRNFDLQRSDGSPIPMLTRDQNQVVSAAALAVAAETILDENLTDDVGRELVLFAQETPKDARARLTRWGYMTERHAADQWQTLLADADFYSACSDLADNWLLLADTPPMPGKRQMIKFSYDEPLEPQRRAWWQRGLAAFGWYPRALTFEVSPPLASSYHFEMPCPPDLEVIGSRLDLGDRSEVDEPTKSRVHLHMSGLEGDEAGRATVLFRASRWGFLLASVLVALLSTILMWVALARLDSIVRSSQNGTAATLLLLAPTAFAAYLVRPGEHKLASAMLRGVRGLVLLAVLPAVSGAVFLAAFDQCRWLHSMWTLATLTATAATVGLTASNILPRETVE